MAVNASEESEAGRSLEGFPGGQHGQTGEALIEWRSSEQVENGSPSTSPPYWDTDDDDDDDDEDDEGAKPSELHEKYTWKIEKFSQLNKRELRSEIFEAGGYQWYILIYPQGCDVCNHLSLFLCVANHDKLLPGWSHFAQFTIAVVNKDPKKSKYSDTLHRFWKKEHDWGWRKFMELSKVFDGFIDSDTLIIKAQVQVIRERADRPFRCLDCQYRRELVRVYLSNVEQICRKFVEEKRAKLKELIEDKPGWSSFCAFWKGMDQNIKRHMSREKIGLILKVVVKHFFIEKEVTSTLVMDALYSGLKALESQSRCDKWGMKLSKTDEFVAPVVHVEKDMFVLVDDLLLLLERAAVEPLPPKDEKGPQNRTKDGSSGDDYNKDSIERDETRLTEMGRRTVETFVLAHIFSRKIEVAHQEAVALRRQEELIREEEEAGLVETEQKTKRRGVEKEKKAKQKQAKQKRNNRKGKDKGRDGKICATMLSQQVQDIPNDEMKDFMTEQAEPVLEKSESLGDVSVVSDSVDFVAETLQADTDGRDQSPISWDTDTSEVHHTTETSSSEISCLSCVQSEVIEKKRSSVMDDSSSSCSTDSVQSLRVNGHCKGNSISNFQTVKPPRRWRNQQGMDKHGCSRLANEMYDQPSAPMTDPRDPNDISRSSKVEEDGSEQHAAKKVEEEAVTLERKLRENGAERPSKEKHGAVQLVLRNPQRSMPCAQLKSDPKVTTVPDPVSVMKPSPKSIQARDKPASPSQPQASASIRAAAPTAPTSRSTTEKPVSVISCPRQPSPVVSVVQTTPLPACSASSCTPQSYRNAIMGSSSTSGGLAHHRSPSLVHQDISFGMGGEDLSSVLNGVHSTVGSQECESSGRLAQVLLVDDFPHLDIINDLLDDDQGIPGSRGLSRQCSLPGDLSDGLCPMGSCRLERALSYRSDGRSSARLDEYVGPVSYVNGVLPNQWHVGASEVLFMGGVNSDVYSYRLPEWQNHGRGIHGFASMFPPSNGH